ncbi:PTS sugar transporter subunit IIA [Yokenella regensburgei]|uniref:PTS sugar transporter subunit IIA n=1 Tax=Yokenella regensburgei TaxID=158877 RepID=UPI003F163E1C
MLGWVIACHDERALALLHTLEAQFAPLVQCRAVNFHQGLSTNMLSRMMCDALHETDCGDGVVFLTDITGAPPYRAAALLSHKHDNCEVISGVDALLLQTMYPLRETLNSDEFRNMMVAIGGSTVSSLWHQQQKNPPFVLLHDLYEK